MIERNPQTIVKLLTKKERASAADLGTDKATMVQLQEAGVVATDGTIKTGRRGKPPVAWVLSEGADLENLPEINEPKRRNAEDGISQAQIDRTIDEVINHTEWGPNCTCGMRAGMSLKDIRALNSGCAERWVCGALDAVRRRLGLYA